jgi:hypothetical protein
MTLKPLRALARPLRAAIVVWMCTNSVGVVVHLAAGILYAAFFTRSFETLIRVSDLVGSIAGLLAWVSWTAVLVLFLMWIYRASKNLRFATDQPLGHSPGSAVVLFFVPVANFFMPQRVMKEIWYASHAGRAAGHAKVNRLWALWIAALAYSLPISVLMASAATAGARSLALFAYAIYYALEVALGFAMLSFVMVCTASYEESVDETMTTPVDRTVVPTEGWYADPRGRHELRFWNGRAWTEWVADAGTQTQDPLQ